MRKLVRNRFTLIYALAAFCAVSMLLAPAVLAQGKQDFILVNKTGVEIYSVYISPHSADDWEEDILGRDTLPNGESTNIHFSRKEKAKLWDLRIEDKKGTAFEWENLNLLEISQVTLYYKNGKAWADTK